MTDAQRLTDLEIKLSFSEDLLEQLNALAARQQLQLDRLQREVLELRQQLREQGPGGGPADERPPHY